MEKTRVLIVTGANEFRTALREFCSANVADVWEAESARRGLAFLHRRPLDLVVAGPDLLREEPSFIRAVRDFDERIEVVAVVDSADRGHAALAEGAYDFFLEPVDFDRLGVVLAHVGEAAEARELSQAFEQQIEGPSTLDVLVGRDPRTIKLFTTARRLARYDTPVLIAGEAGTGKESLARALHAVGRSGRPFVVLHAADAGTAELERASSEAGGGTVYIDDVLALRPEVTAGLVGVLDRSAIDNGGPHFRVIAACREDAGRRCSPGTVQEDLYLRLREAALSVPPLRERRDDIVPIANAILGAPAGDVEGPRFGRDVAEALVAYDWPGNVDELRGTLEAAASSAHGRAIELRDLPPALRSGPPSTMYAELDSRRLADIEAAHLKKALAETRGNKARAARILGLSRWALQRKLQKHGISMGELSP